MTDRPFYGAECPSYPDCEDGCGLGCTKKIENARAAMLQPASVGHDTWVKILADNWRGRNGNSTTGDSVRNSCADELEKVAARNGLTALAQSQAITHRWRSFGAHTWIYDPEPEWLEDHQFEVEWEPVYGAPQSVHPAQAWQAVETAPHETLVLLGWWYDGVWFSEVGAASHGWRRNGISNMSRHGQATHWQPLPDGPVVSSTDREGGKPYDVAFHENMIDQLEGGK